MRLDKFLKTSRIFKRRTIAKEIALHDKVLINNRMAKPSSDVKVNDIIIISYKDKSLTFKVLDISQHASKDEATGMYEIIEEK